jgi:Nuclease A inhibitor-like protein
MSDLDLVEQLQNAASGLLWISESDYPFEAFVWNIQSSNPENFLRAQQLRQYTGHASDTPVKTLEIDRFFAPATRVENWHDESKAKEVLQYQALVKQLKDELKNLSVYLLGTVELDIYIIGKTPSGNWAGLSTKAIET